MAFLSRCMLSSRVLMTAQYSRALSTSAPLAGKPEENTIHTEAAKDEEKIRFHGSPYGHQLEEDASKPLFGPESLSGHFGTPANPALVPSFCDSRLVGCTGGAGPLEHDVLWHYVNEDKPTVCLECGQFFVMEKLHHTDLFVDPNHH
mmetsp:Transcript_28342/g.43921  ORF Transcript_28342/g.43921 Transcript_28342/m.43921 type:complete len:147 (-) Transcript_28342:139-579(-)|eukprot:CAMPEP_0201522340 /NCGR_PEP_ID=MMETSP0161_2-20130828/16999_1 /ASSEMBLY_ACC=CAM_ASM_000251 /TAXON_ID=180227 /ORGANISM="Neoparamoeba aestuarina, Strain SoJaBio B1-5/56/2" /LENGTH=146 /DNA_ID=CAMNT_0047921157 /DNA_START=55 /DNA_END=495 /DNA_ORIENTATION=+